MGNRDAGFGRKSPLFAKVDEEGVLRTGSNSACRRGRSTQKRQVRNQIRQAERQKRHYANHLAQCTHRKSEFVTKLKVVAEESQVMCSPVGAEAKPVAVEKAVHVRRVDFGEPVEV